MRLSRNEDKFLYIRFIYESSAFWNINSLKFRCKLSNTFEDYFEGFSMVFEPPLNIASKSLINPAT